MKLSSILILLTLCCIHHIQGQNFDKKHNKYSVWVILSDKPFEVQGTLYKLKDTTVMVSHYKTFSEFIIDESPAIELPINNIEIIETRKRNRVRNGILLGAVSGFAVGGLIGLARGDDAEQTAGQKAMVGGLSLALPGALVGLLVGAVKVSFPIEGSILKYKNQRQKLQKYSTN